MATPTLKLKKKNARILCFDTETTGLPRSMSEDLDLQPHIVEFAGIVLNQNKEEIERISFLVKPPISIPQGASRINGITGATVRDAKPWADWHQRIHELIAGCDAVIAHNLAFDKKMLNIEAKRLNLRLRWPDAQICTVRETRHLRNRRLKLAELYEISTGEKMRGAHRAMADCEALAEITRRAMVYDGIAPREDGGGGGERRGLSLGSIAQALLWVGGILLLILLAAWGTNEFALQGSLY